MKYVFGICLGLVVTGSSALAQGTGTDTIFNKNGMERIAYYEQFFKYRVNRMIDLNEKQNTGLNSRKGSLARLILDLVAEGKLKTYGTNIGDPGDFEEEIADTVATVLGSNFVRSQTRGDWSPNESYYAGDYVIYQGKVYQARQEVRPPAAPRKGQPAGPAPKDPKSDDFTWADQGDLNNTLKESNVAGFELIEDVIFDKRRSRLYYDVLAIGIALEDPASGRLTSRFIISYKQLVREIERLARSKNMADRRRVTWQNQYNPSESKTFLEAFKLRSFHGIILKVENPENMTIQQMYEANGQPYDIIAFARWEEEMKLMEKEHNLWEY
ncbi:MAG: hypothetical protein MUC38_06145 [Cyclobacteriaceae bacterium]|nr:hypothetical protein [Cyclobacteriaceae bacterium]